MTSASKHGHFFEKFTRTWCFRVFMLTVVLIPLFLSPGFADLKAMDTKELKSATAQAGFCEFSLNNDTARIFLDIHIETVATIDRFSAGYHDGGWDQTWTDVSLGTDSDNPLTLDGLVFLADFAEGSLETDPVLERLVVGSNRLQGTLSAMISSFSGMYSSALTGGGSPDIILSRYDLSGSGTNPTTFNFDSQGSTEGDQGLFLILNTDPTHVGIQILAGYNENTIPDISPGTPWWDSP